MNLFDKKKKELRSLLLHKGSRPAIHSLKDSLHENTEAFKTFIIIQSRFKMVKRKEQRDVIGLRELSIENNLITESLLNFISDLEKKDLNLFSFIDPRDSRIYEKIELHGKIWMAENLNFDVGNGCWFYNDDPKNGKKYGRLYAWEAAQKACPPGWRLPTAKEIEELINHLGGAGKSAQALKKGGSTSFNAQFGGYRFKEGNCVHIDEYGTYWTGTEENDHNACYYMIDNNGAFRLSAYKVGASSCRCIKD